MKKVISIILGLSMMFSTSAFAVFNIDIPHSLRVVYIE